MTINKQTAATTLLDRRGFKSCVVRAFAALAVVCLREARECGVCAGAAVLLSCLTKRKREEELGRGLYLVTVI